MNIIDKTKDIIRTYKLNNTGEPFTASEKLSSEDPHSLSEKLWDKYESRIPQGWYGFDTYGWPINWLLALEEFLTALEIDSPEFEIHQIKLKWGGARIYLCNYSFEAGGCISELENVMRDVSLIY